MKNQFLTAVLFLGLGVAVAGCSGSPSRGETTIGNDAATHSLVAALPAIDGKSHILLPGDQPTILVFWATWCAPCRRELPALGQAFARLGDRAHWFGVLAGSDDQVDLSKVRSLTAQHGVRYPQLRDRSGELVKSLAVKGTPTIIVLGPRGEIRYREHQLPDSWELLLGD
ncbi:MAG: TlpA family protein disulfide reductase [Planctomycetes bacterium]|nr:TlpA family protein disulfide reductase [Planctomycetota bacterium]MBT6968629.1 TlpA family protein disulfide reductase [Planctomycetota bacterium]